MINNSTPPAEIYCQLTAAYSKLSPWEKETIQLLSVCYQPVGRSAFLSCLNQSGIRDNWGRLFSTKTLKTALDHLLDQGLLFQDRGSGIRCHPLLVEIATREAVLKGRFEGFANVVREKFLPASAGRNSRRYFTSREQLICEVRIAIYRQNYDEALKQLTDYNRYGFGREEITLNDVLLTIFNNPFDKEWICRLPEPMLCTSLWDILLNSALLCEPAVEPFSLLQELCTNKNTFNSDLLKTILAEQLLLRGELEECGNLLATLPPAVDPLILPLKGWLTFLLGDNDQALHYFANGLAVFRKKTKKRAAFFDDISGIFFILALLKTGNHEKHREAVAYADKILKQSGHSLGPIFAVLKMVLLVQQGDLSRREEMDYSPESYYDSPNRLTSFFYGLCHYWVGNRKNKGALEKCLEKMVAKAEKGGVLWLATEAAELLSRLKPESSYGTKAALWRRKTGVISIVDMVGHEEPWELCLKALASLTKSSSIQEKAVAECRLAWLIRYHHDVCSIQPKEQRISAKGSWSKGRNIALKRLATKPGDIPYLTDHDLRVCAHIESHSYGYYGQTQYEFNDRAVLALAGHPLVFWEDAPSSRVEIVKGDPELLVKKKKEGRLQLEFAPVNWQGEHISFIKESPLRLKVVEISAEHRRIAEILPDNRLEIPAGAEDRVLAAIKAVSAFVTVHSDIGTGEENVEKIETNSRPHIHLLPVGEGLKIAVLSRPFPEGGPYYRPGEGCATVIAEIDDKRLQTIRNLSEEKRLANEAMEACPTLARIEEEQNEWLIDDPEECLELLLELRELGDAVALEWPEGEKLRIRNQAGLDDFKFRIQRQRDWFAAEGELKLDDGLVLDMQALLKLTEKTSSRIVPLGEGQFLALTREFRKRLDELRTYSEKFAKGVRFHPLAALALEELTAEVGDFKADQHWKAHIGRLAETQSLQTPLPSTLQAEFRDYQIEGFQWLARLAHAGMGACLADDMGLGKTLQALAVILIRAPEGPTLVLAPTSVCMNWVSEAERFTPTLRPLQFINGDRQQQIDKLQPFDLLICSYGLLQQKEVARILSAVEWQTIVLDEAQAIKNYMTKRSQAAMNLQGGFKLITTGTPIENHLGEFWNLFRFINPGLLGSLESFNQRFAQPIEKMKDKQARAKLKKLIQPFLLRRTKSQVLEELPSRTEVLLHVDLSSEEMAFYEALRRDAVDKLASSDAAAGGQHLQVLAEIMKLRRACCNARLVMPDTQLSSAKLQLFGEVLEELLESRHKALVFSQFVGHLQILREYLDEQKIAYQYLDGSTPARERKKRVDAFQAGEGHVFLISLKAGGTGLNLTAADYVIHMDPWWNPAVEDQASDRAHRIGQVRPVTIYRLVARGTIEDKIVELHQHKRDLADSLLEGTDMSGKISTDELLQLIRE